MGYMKWVKGLMDTGRHSILRQKYDEAIEGKFQRIEFDNSNLDVKFVANVLDFIDKNDDAHTATRNDKL
jgi:hypothetical protein